MIYLTVAGAGRVSVMLSVNAQAVKQFWDIKATKNSASRVFQLSGYDVE
jgi:hypothetical protein